MMSIRLIHPEGWRFVGLFALVTLVLFYFSTSIGWIGGVLTCWCFYFFRNPKRVTPQRDGLLISPADGKVVLIQEVVPPSDFGIGDEPRTRISIFLNVFDVHINFIPIKGTIKKILYHPGRFLNASLDKASEFNERNAIVMDSDFGDLAFVQIAGLIARRIRCDAVIGDDVNAGEYYGLIRFGSRVDVYLPKGACPQICLGQRMIARETVLADLKSDDPARVGRVVEKL